MLVFQVLLLGGYIYSHAISARVSVMAQTKIHLALLSIAFLMVLMLSFRWPSAITPSPSWKPQGGGDPTREVVALILVAAGLPFFVLSTTGPLLQRWFGRLGGGDGTYKLYSVSNAGSLLGLLSFPFLLEPALPMRAQGVFWTVLFCVFVVGCGICASQARESKGETPPPHHVSENGSEGRTTVSTYLLWFLLAACPSSLLLATTNLLCQEVASVPLLWVLPLALYLISFILCFDNPRWYRRSIFHPFFSITLLLTCGALIISDTQAPMFLLPALLFFGCMICHGELVRLKPNVRQLTAFYLTISAGGAAGGIFVGIVAPHLFSFFTEFQLTLATTVFLLLVCLWLDPDSWLFERDFHLPALLSGGIILAAYMGGLCLPGVAQLLATLHFYPIAALIGAFVVLSAYIMRRTKASNARGFRFVQICAVCLALLALVALYRTTKRDPDLYRTARNFYGVVRVLRYPAARVLWHGRTVHGMQLDPPYDKEPLTYYGPQSGIGIVLQNHPKRNVAGETLRIGLIGLGAGSLAAYGRPGDYFKYYEINPAVVEYSSGAKPVFTYIRDSAAHVDTAVGDARLLLENELMEGRAQKFDVLVLDAFSGDAIPVHLLTREAFETYWKHMNSDSGIIAVHVTNRHVNLFPVLQGVCAYFHADCVLNVNKPEFPFMTSHWVFLSRRAGVLNIRGLTPTLGGEKIPPRLWTDGYSDIFRLLQ